MDTKNKKIQQSYRQSAHGKLFGTTSTCTNYFETGKIFTHMLANMVDSL